MRARTPRRSGPRTTGGRVRRRCSSRPTARSRSAGAGVRSRARRLSFGRGCEHAVPRTPGRRPVAGRRGDGHAALLARDPAALGARRAGPVAAGADRLHPPRVPGGRGGPDRDRDLRRQPRPPRPVRPRRPGRPAGAARRPDRPRGPRRRRSRRPGRRVRRAARRPDQRPRPPRRRRRCAPRSARPSTACSRAASTCSCSRRSRRSTTSRSRSRRRGWRRPTGRSSRSLTFGEEIALPDGTTPAPAAAALAAFDVDAIGVNCGAGPQGCLDALTAMGDRGAVDPAERRAPAAGRGPVRLRREPRLPRADGRRHAGCRGAADRRLLRDDARAHRRDARAPSTPGPPPRPGSAAATADTRSAPATTPRLTATATDRRPARCRAAADRARPGAAGRPVRRLGGDRPAALGPHRSHDRGRPPAQGRRRRHGQRQRLGDGPRPDGRARGRVRDPARPRPRVRRPHDDPRPEPHGARVRAAGRARARRAEHPGPDRRPAAGRRLPDRARASGTSIRSGSSRSWPGSTAARTPPAARSAPRPGSPSPARSTRRPPTPRPNGTASSARSPPAPT